MVICIAFLTFVIRQRGLTVQENRSTCMNNLKLVRIDTSALVSVANYFVFISTSKSIDCMENITSTNPHAFRVKLCRK